FFCFPRGRAKLNVSVPKKNFNIGGSIKADCELDNTECNENGRKIKVQFFQNIKLRDSFGSVKEITRVVSEMTFRKKYRSKKINKFTIEMPLCDKDNPAVKYK